MHILVDTNVYLDLILERGESSDIAQSFFRNAIKSKSKIFLSSYALRDIGYVVARILHSQEMGKQAQLRAYELCHEVVSLSNDAVVEALYSDMKDYEDAMLVEMAKSEMINLIITNNIKDFENASFPVWTPLHFNKVIEQL